MAGFRSRGWGIENVSDVENSRASIRTFQAVRGDERLTVTITNADIGGTMTVKSGDGSAIGVIPGDFGVSRTVVNENGASRAISLQNTHLMLSGNRNHVVVSGRSPLITVNGSDNDVTVQATVGRIEVNGQRNVVRWSVAANPTPPQVLDNGSGNRVSSAP
jgi:hypothetical protein